MAYFTQCNNRRNCHLCQQLHAFAFTNRNERVCHHCRMYSTTPTFRFKYDFSKKISKKISSGSIKNTWRLVKSVKKLSSTTTLVADELESLSIADSTLSRSTSSLGLVSSLGYDLSILIFAYLSSKDLCRCGQVSRDWRSLSHEAALWQEYIPIQPELDGLLELYKHHKGLWWKTFYIDYQSQKSKWARLAFQKWEVFFQATISW